MRYQRCHSFVDASRHVVGRFCILRSDVFTDLIEFGQGSDGPDKVLHLYLGVRRRPLGFGNAVAVPRERIQAIAWS